MPNTVSSKLYRASREGTLTYGLLSRAVYELHSRAPFAIPMSVGGEWISRRIPIFLGMDIDHAEFITAHSHYREFVQYVLMNKELLGCIPAEDRDDFVIKHFSLTLTTDMEALLEAGIDRSLLVTAIRDSLVAVEPKVYECLGFLDPVSIFLKHEPDNGWASGCLSREEFEEWKTKKNAAKRRATPPRDCWTILTEDEFAQMAELCVERRPLLFVKRRKNLALWMSENKLQGCLDQALSKITKIDTLSVSIFECFSAEACMSLVGRLDRAWIIDHPSSTAKLIIQTLMKLSEEEGRKFLLDATSIVDSVGALDYGWQLAKEDKGQRLAWFRDLIGRRLEDQGFIRGVLVKGSCRYANNQSSLLELHVCRAVYIQDRNDRRVKGLVEGDEVFVHPSTAHTLYESDGKKIRRADFLSLTKPRSLF